MKIVKMLRHLRFIRRVIGLIIAGAVISQLAGYSPQTGEKILESIVTVSALR